MDPLTLLGASIVYAEAAGQNDEFKKAVGSTFLNRIDSPRKTEYGMTPKEVAQKGYYSVSQNSDLFKQAMSQKFPDEKSEIAFKKSVALFSGLAKGMIKRSNAEFMFNDKEVAKLKRKKAFNFDLVEETEEIQGFTFYKYK